MRIIFNHINVMTLLCFLALSPLSVQSEEFTCPIKMEKAGEQFQWRVTNTSCPHGEGLWGDNVSASKQGMFWVQCAITGALPEPWFAKLLSKIVPANEIMLKKESKKYRCLLGPYQRYSTAMTVLKKMRAHSELKNAFVRQVQDGKMAMKQTVKAFAPVGEKEDDVMMDGPLTSTVIQDEKAKTALMQREFHQIGSLYSPIPSETDPNYSEGGKKWIRAPFETANKICNENGLKIVSIDVLKKVLEKETNQENLPKRLPYWVEDKVAFDILMMVPISLTENSAIYMLCG